MFFGVSLMGSRLPGTLHNAKHFFSLGDDGSAEQESGKHHYVRSGIWLRDRERHIRLKKRKRPKFLQEVKDIYLIFHYSRSWAGVEGWWNLPCLPYLLFNYSSCFQWEEKLADTRASLNFEKAAAPPLPICLHDVKPATGYWLSHMRTLMGRNPESQPVHGRPRLVIQTALFPDSDQRGGSPRCTQVPASIRHGRGGEANTEAVLLVLNSPS